MTELIKWKLNLFPVKFKKQMGHSQINEKKESGANRQRMSPLIDNLRNSRKKAVEK